MTSLENTKLIVFNLKVEENLFIIKSYARYCFCYAERQYCKIGHHTNLTGITQNIGELENPYVAIT